MEARVSSEVLIYHRKTSNRAFYEIWTKEYKHWMTGTMGLAIQTIPPVCLVIESQHRTAEGSPQNIARSPQLCRSFSSAGMRCPGAQTQSGYAEGFILCPVQDQASSSREQNQHRVQDDNHRGPFSKSLTPRFGATGFVLSKERWEMCHLSTLSAWSGRGALSTKFFF